MAAPQQPEDDEMSEMAIPECVNIWELQLEGDEASVTSLSMSSKGKLAAVASMDGEIVIVDAHKGTIRCRLAGHRGGTNAVAFVGGASLASCGEDGTVKLWSLAKQACILEYPFIGVDADRTPTGSCVGHLTVSPDSLSFAAAAGRSIVLFSAPSAAAAAAGQFTPRIMDPLKSTVEALRFDATRGVLVAGCNGGVTLWDLAGRAGEERQALDFAYDGACLCVDVSPSMEWIVGGCHDATLHIWQLVLAGEGGWDVREMACGGYERAVKLTDFDATGKRLASAGGTRGTVWDFSETPAGSVPTLTLMHHSTITTQAWQPEEPFLLATGDRDGQVFFHDIDNAEAEEEGDPKICLPGVVAPCDDKDEVTAFAWGLKGLFIAGHVSGIVRGWALPEIDDSSSEEEEEEGEEEQEEEENNADEG